MSASDEWTEWHLTPAGWVRGTTKTDFSRTDREPPADRVMTVIYSEYVSSSFSAMNKSLEIEWQSGDAVIVEKCKTQFGSPPESL